MASNHSLKARRKISTMNLLKDLSLCALIFLTAAGCSAKVELPASRMEATEKLTKILENDYSYAPVIHWAKDTLWIYLPETSALYAIEGSSAKPSSTPKKYILQYISVLYQDRAFLIEHDVVEATKITTGAGMSTRYSQAFNEQYRNATTAISRTFFAAQNPPAFIVLVIADIQNGLATKTVFYAEDLKRYFTQSIPPEEYAVRVRTEPYGDPNIVGDRQGKHISYDEISFPEFLAKQIAYRINFKFQSSDFPPDKNVDEEILDAVVKTVQAYNFNDFTHVIFQDLRAKEEQTVTREQVDRLREPLPQEDPLNKSKIITIDFSDIWKKDQDPQGSLQKDLVE